MTIASRARMFHGLLEGKDRQNKGLEWASPLTGRGPMTYPKTLQVGVDFGVTAIADR